MFLRQAYKTATFVSYGYMNWTRGSFLKHQKEFKDEEMVVDLTDKQCLVTGANTGIGYASAEALAARGATVHLVCRSKEKGEKAVGEIKAKTGNPNVSLQVCDLSSLQQVKDFAAEYTSSGRPLHILVNNAGLMETERTQTADGLETNFAVNVAGVYAMTELLMPALKRASPESRVITVSSGGMLTENLNENLQYEDKNVFDGTTQYARNKRVQVALTEYWVQKHKDAVGFYSMHPGWVDTGGLKKSMPDFHSTFQKSLRFLNEGTDTITWLALQPRAKLQNGEFYFDRKVAAKHLPGFGTQYTPKQVATIASKIHSLCGLPPMSD
jgi:dehydrogenase/reductase SDR family protein 12